MSHDISKTKLERFSVFSVCSKKYGYGHYNRVQNLISILKNKNKIFTHYSFGEKNKNKKQFLDKLKLEVNLNNNIILDITNNLFLDDNTILEIKKILDKKNINYTYIIDSPTGKNLSTILNLKYTKTLIPFEIDNEIKKKLLKKIKNVQIGFKYFIYSNKNIKIKKKIFDIVLSFGGSDNYEATFYVLNLLKKLKIKKRIVVVVGKYFKDKYKKKVLSFCKKNKFQTKSFSKNFNDILNKSRLLITNSGLTKYEGFAHGLPVIVFSDTKESQKIDKVFIKKTKQIHFSYVKKPHDDMLKLKKILKKHSKFKFIDQSNNESYTNNIKSFFNK